MFRTIFLFLCGVLGILSHVPNSHMNPKEVNDKCLIDFPLPTDTLKEFRNRHITDTDQMRNFLYCIATSLEIYSDDDGFDVDRLCNRLYREPELDCKKSLVHNCIDLYGEEKLDAGKVLKTFKCIADNENKINDN